MASSQRYEYANESHLQEYSESKYLGESQGIATGQCQSYYRDNSMVAGNGGQHYGYSYNPSHGHKHGQFHTHVEKPKVYGYEQACGSTAIADQIQHHVEKKKYTDSYGNVVEYYSASDNEYYSDRHGRGC